MKSLRTNGRLIRLVGETLIPHDADSLARLTGCDIDTVRAAMQLFQSIGIVQISQIGEIYLPQVQEMVGSETDKAKMMRKLRAERANQLHSGKIPQNDAPQTGVSQNDVPQNNVPGCYTTVTQRKEKTVQR
ncbi:MAG: phage replisome organizer N-terminal domain-containing protein [Acutalibacteraceae bacterium]